jgi:leader peptidase (prepilin peptidase)/N-methyltransferase
MSAAPPDHNTPERPAAQPGPVRSRFLKVLIFASLPLLGYAASAVLPRLVIYAGYAAALLSVAYTDYRQRRIPNAIIYPALLFALGAAFHFPGGPLNALAGGGATALLFLVPVFIYGPQRAGIGDVKLGLFVGLILGLTPALFWALLLAFGLGAVVGLTGVLFGDLTRHSSLPFGPYMAFGAIAGLLISLTT